MESPAGSSPAGLFLWAGRFAKFAKGHACTAVPPPNWGVINFRINFGLSAKLSRLTYIRDSDPLDRGVVTLTVTLFIIMTRQATART